MSYRFLTGSELICPIKASRTSQLVGAGRVQARDNWDLGGSSPSNCGIWLMTATDSANIVAAKRCNLVSSYFATISLSDRDSNPNYLIS